MSNCKVTGLGTPTNNTDAATKKYVDDKKCKFLNGETTTNDVDISVYGFNNGVKFDSGAYSKGIDASDPPSALVNKHSLATAGLIDIERFSPSIKKLFPHRFLMLKGTPTSYAVVYKDPLFNGNPTYRAATDSCELIISFKSDLPTAIYKYSFDIFYQRLSLPKFSCKANVEELGTKPTQSISIGNGLVPTRHSKLMLVVVIFIGSGVVKYISKELLGITVSILKVLR